MGKVSDIIPIGDLRKDAAKILKRIKKSKEPLVIAQRCVRALRPFSRGANNPLLSAEDGGAELSGLASLSHRPF